MYNKVKNKLQKAKRVTTQATPRVPQVVNGVLPDAEASMFPVSQRLVSFTVSNVYLLGGVDDSSDFIAACEVLNTSEEGDIVMIHLQSPGGCVSSGDMLLHAIQTAQERGVEVHCVATGLCASLATWILLACNSFELAAGFHALIHSGSVGGGGTFGEFQAYSKFYGSYLESRLRQIYEGFLTEEEVTEVIEGKDMWLTPEQWVERFQVREKYFEALSTQVADDEQEMEAL